jgi:hypothetical protein
MIASVIKIRVKIWLRGKSFRFKIEENSILVQITVVVKNSTVE